jgi:excisionase family DNA binding protein
MGDGVVRTLQEWMQYMEERKRRVREAEAEVKERKDRQRTESAPVAKQEAAAGGETGALTSPRARRVVAPAASGGVRGGLAAALAGGSGAYGGTLARGVEQAREQMTRALRARQAGQGELPLGLPPTEGARASRRSADETRDELIERLLDPELTLQETAKLLNVCPTTVRRYTNRGVLHHFRTPGNQRRFRLSDVLEFMRRQQRSPGGST